ncbi:hypothetical protein [Microbacterium sp. SS28]|uniref:hypothetical protein n=1 Tax=Microbacterium sp. SS28 TaxID=2919948 RepID=UPI001FAA497C|nr:hypothetical protein [Microbacterium sp. SS28]
MRMRPEVRFGVAIAQCSPDDLVLALRVVGAMLHDVDIDEPGTQVGLVKLWKGIAAAIGDEINTRPVQDLMSEVDFAAFNGLDDLGTTD